MEKETISAVEIRFATGSIIDELESRTWASTAPPINPRCREEGGKIHLCPRSQAGTACASDGDGSAPQPEDEPGLWVKAADHGWGAASLTLLWLV